jgi:DNA-binding XRE family transcriptional regulator
VVIPRTEYERLSAHRATAKLPPLPPVDRHGQRDAEAAVRAVMARSLIQQRLKAGLEQRELAKQAGVCAETISRLESGRYRPQRATILRLEKVLAKA